jgi:hypothetical protein
MRALAASKVSVVHKKGRRKSNKEAEKGTRDKQNIGETITLRSPSSFQILDTFSAQSDKFLYQDLSKKKHMSMKITQGTKVKIPGPKHTSSEKHVDGWISREALASINFFKCLEP